MKFIDNYLTGSVQKLAAELCKSIELPTICEYMIKDLPRIPRINDIRPYYDLG